MIATPEANLICGPEIAKAWWPPERYAPSEWAEQNVILPPDAPIKGRLDHRNAPYLPGIMDIANTPGVAQVNTQKAGQIGVSAMCRWLMGFWARQDPAPCGLTLPDKNKGRKIVSGEVIPFFRDTRVLRDLMTSRSTDESGERLRLQNGFTLHLMWAGSASSTASFPLKRVINDEVDKMKSWARGGGEGHAVHRTKTRLRVFAEQAIQINVSTPTTSLGVIHRLFNESDVQLHFVVPCPHCGERIRLIWSQVKWRHYREDNENREWASRVKEEHAAWYECQSCGEKIDDRQRRQAVQLGKWATVDEETAVADGVIEDAASIEEWPAGTSIGMQISALYCMWTRLWNIAADYILTLGNLERMYSFITETLGEPFEQQIERVHSTRFQELSESAELPEGIVPWWAAKLIAVADTQKDHFWLTIRAWGPGMRSARVFHGRIEEFDDLDKLCFRTPFRVQDDRYQPMTCELMLIDSGGTKVAGVSRTMEVYAWVLDRSAHVRAIKGDNRAQPGQFYRRGKGWYDPGEDSSSEKIEVPLWLLDVHHYQDELADLMSRKVRVGVDDNGSPMYAPLWLLNQRNDAEYNEHMSNLRKVAEQEGGTLVQRWRPITNMARVDYRACEGYQIAGAYMRMVHLLPSLEDFEAARQAEIKSQNETPRSPGGITQPDGRPFIATSY